MIEFFATIINADDVPRSMPHCGILKANGDVKKAPIYGIVDGYCNSPECAVRSGDEPEYHWYCPTQNDIDQGMSGATRNFCECEKNEDRIKSKGRKVLHYFDEDDLSDGGTICSYCYSFCEREGDEYE